MTQNLTLVTQKPFGSITCNFYKDDAIENEFYMTRRQIGEALGYVKADDAIQQIHDRNKDRLDPLSTTLTLGGVEGNRWVNRNTRVYTLRGVMEICRFSRQPNADKFMDFVWDVMESLYHGRSVLATPDQTSAVAMQTIQALVDSTLKTQAETTRCMVTMTSTLLPRNPSPSPPRIMPSMMNLPPASKTNPPRHLPRKSQMSLLL